ncbi:MAG: winged helix-turn-helix domain-containing protein [Dehalococcoidia bacterium]
MTSRQTDHDNGTTLEQEHALITLNHDLFVAECNGDRLELTAREFDLLALLIREQHRVLPREELHRRVWNTGGSGLRVVDTYVSRLRTKLKMAGHPGIAVLRKRGYRLLGADDD